MSESKTICAKCGGDVVFIPFCLHDEGGQIIEKHSTWTCEKCDWMIDVSESRGSRNSTIKVDTDSRPITPDPESENEHE